MTLQIWLGQSCAGAPGSGLLGWWQGHHGQDSSCHFLYSLSPVVSLPLAGLDISRELGNETESLPLKAKRCICAVYLD